MVAAKAHGRLSFIKQVADGALDRGKCAVRRQFHVPRIQHESRVKFDSTFGGRI
jgi:hypothetical protein